MDISAAKTLFKEKYINTGFELVDEHEKELYFQYLDSQVNIKITKEELAEYCEFKPKEISFNIAPVECSICSNNYREQKIDLTISDQRRFFINRDEIFSFGNKTDGKLYVEISPASSDFINYFRFDKAYLNLTTHRYKRKYLRKDPPTSLNELLYRPITIKIYNINESTIEAAITKTNLTIDTCLFVLSYLKNIVFRLEEKWIRRKLNTFRPSEEEYENEFNIPEVAINPDIIKYYHRALSTDDPVNQFLALYQVLEYFFIVVSDEQLYNKISNRIGDPKFKLKPQFLDRIIQDVLENRNTIDETDMLKNVLNKYVDEGGLIGYINNYENFLGEHVFTKKNNIFGLENEVKLIQGHIMGNLAKRIKHIRNCLVHSSDRYERKERYIPSVDSETLIFKEIPLLKYIAEEIIIATAKKG
jgi:hypothetical protein